METNEFSTPPDSGTTVSQSAAVVGDGGGGHLVLWRLLLVVPVGIVFVSRVNVFPCGPNNLSMPPSSVGHYVVSSE